MHGDLQNNLQMLLWHLQKFMSQKESILTMSKYVGLIGLAKAGFVNKLYLFQLFVSVHG